MSPNVKALKMGFRHMALCERDIRILRNKSPELTTLTCQDEFIVSSMYVGVDSALIGFGACISELWRAVKNNDFHRTRELQEEIFPMAEVIYGMGEPSGDAHACMKKAPKQQRVFSSALKRPPVLPFSEQENACGATRGRNSRPPLVPLQAYAAILGPIDRMTHRGEHVW